MSIHVCLLLTSGRRYCEHFHSSHQSPEGGRDVAFVHSTIILFIWMLRHVPLLSLLVIAQTCCCPEIQAEMTRLVPHYSLGIMGR